MKILKKVAKRIEFKKKTPINNRKKQVITIKRNPLVT
jgi:hypothetical protein